MHFKLPMEFWLNPAGTPEETAATESVEAAIKTSLLLGKPAMLFEK